MIADDEIDMVGFDQLLGLLHADFGFLRVVLVDDLNRQAAELAAEMVEAKLEGVAHVVADERRSGPLNVLTKPILTVFCWAKAGLTPAGSAANASAAAASTNPVLIIRVSFFLAALIRCGGVSGDC